MANQPELEVFTVVVGQPYIADKREWQEGIDYNFVGGTHDLRLFLRHPTDEEVEAVSAQPFRVGVLVDQPVIILTFSAGDLHGDGSYAWQRMVRATGDETLPYLPKLNERALLHVTLVDAATGIVKALRAGTFSPAVTSLLHKAIREQAQAAATGEWDEAAFDRKVKQIYAAHGDMPLIQSAKAVCVLGD